MSELKTDQNHKKTKKVTKRIKENFVNDVLKLEQHELYLLRNILDKHKCKYSTNNNGVYIDLGNVSDNIINEMLQQVKDFKNEKEIRKTMSDTCK